MRPVALWCVAFLLGVRAAVVTFGADVVDRKDIRGAAAYLKEAHQSDLRVVFFGSSRMQSAVLPEIWARRARMRPDQVANLAVNDGRLWDALYMLERARGLPDSVVLVVVEVAHWEFNRNVLNPIFPGAHAVPQHFRSWAGLRERIAVDDWWTRLSLLGDLAWPVYERRPLAKWQWRTDTVAPVPPSRPRHQLDPRAEARLANAAAFKAAAIARKHFHQAALSSFARRNLRELIRRMRAPFRKIVLLQLPVREAYLRVVHEDPQRQGFYRAVQRLARSYESSGVVSILWERANDCGLKETVFVDYGHLNERGAETFTNRLFDEIISSGLASALGAPLLPASGTAWGASDDWSCCDTASAAGELGGPGPAVPLTVHSRRRVVASRLACLLCGS